MDIETKDGIVLRNIPEGTPDDVIRARIEKIRAENNRPSSLDVTRNALYGAAASIPDALLNTPNRLMNLGRAAGGSVMNALGMPEHAPEITPDPDYVRRLLEHTGVIKAGVVPQGAQRYLDAGLRGATAGVLTGGASLPSATAGAFSSIASQGAADAGLPVSAQITAGMLAPQVTKAPQIAARTADAFLPGVTQVVPNYLLQKAENLMYKALKPPIEAHRKGEDTRAVQTLLDTGVNVTPGGLAKLNELIDAQHLVQTNAIGNSKGRVNPQTVVDAVGPTRSHFSKLPSHVEDLAAIDKTVQGFLSIPEFRAGSGRLEQLRAELKAAEASKISALQDAGRFQSFAAQQRNLGHGGNINLAREQTPNAPYFNVGGLDLKINPQAYVPMRYGVHPTLRDRVPEGEAAFRDAMTIYEKARLREGAAQKALNDYIKSGEQGTVSVQTANEIKRAIQQKQANNFGERGTPASETEKALQYGLRTRIAEQEPMAAAALRRESELINARDLVDRRVFNDAKKMTAGLAPLASGRLGALLFLTDRSPFANSILARGLYNLSEAQIPQGLNVPPTVPLYALLANQQGAQ